MIKKNIFRSLIVILTFSLIHSSCAFGPTTPQSSYQSYSEQSYINKSHHAKLSEEEDFTKSPGDRSQKIVVGILLGALVVAGVAVPLLVLKK